MKRYILCMLDDEWFRVNDKFIKYYYYQYWIKFDEIIDANHIISNKKELDNYYELIYDKQIALKIRINSKDINLKSLKKLIKQEVKNFQLLKEII